MRPLKLEKLGRFFFLHVSSVYFSLCLYEHGLSGWAGLEDKTPLAHQLEPLINSPEAPSPQWKGSVPQDREKKNTLL